MSQENIRSYIEVVTEMLLTEAAHPTMLVEDVHDVLPSPTIEHVIEDEVNGLIFKLRSYQDPESGDYALGVEAGMNRAADMLQNMINRLRGE
jgi:hypothetical protein